MATFGLIGYPLGHSRSQQFFMERFRQSGNSNHSFLNFSIPSLDDLESIFQSQTDLKGLAVTIPFKQEIRQYVDELDPVAERVGAVNCIRILNGHKKGYNTDVVGIEQSLLELLDNARPGALILGTGGAASAVAYVLKKMGIRFRFVSRQSQEAETLVYEQMDAEVLRQHPLVINCSPVGMYPDIENYPLLPYEAVNAGHYFFDLIYNPVETLFLSKARQNGAKTMNGEKMFLLQAEENWKIWNS
jgi:shikimate dehydrogenase